MEEGSGAGHGGQWTWIITPEARSAWRRHRQNLSCCASEKSQNRNGLAPGLPAWMPQNELVPSLLSSPHWEDTEQAL